MSLDELLATRSAILVPDAIGRPLASDVRGRLEPQYRRYALVDRGSYEEVVDPIEPQLVGLLARLAGEATGRALTLVDTRALRLGPGDYLLARHDRARTGRA